MDKDIVLEVLDLEWKSTQALTVLLNRKYHWYTVKDALEKLYAEKKVDKMELGKFNYWKALNKKEVINT